MPRTDKSKSRQLRAPRNQINLLWVSLVVMAGLFCFLAKTWNAVIRNHDINFDIVKKRCQIYMQ